MKRLYLKLNDCNNNNSAEKKLINDCDMTRINIKI